MTKGNYVKQVREGLGYSQADFAKKLHTTRKTLWNWENEGTVTHITLMLLMRLADENNLDIEKPAL